MKPKYGISSKGGKGQRWALKCGGATNRGVIKRDYALGFTVIAYCTDKGHFIGFISGVEVEE